MPFANQSIFSCYRVQNLLSEIMWYEVNRCERTSICKVGDCGLQTYQTVTILKRATTYEFTTIQPILYIHCCGALFFPPISFLSSSFWIILPSKFLKFFFNYQIIIIFLESI